MKSKQHIANAKQEKTNSLHSIQCIVIYLTKAHPALSFFPHFNSGLFKAVTLKSVKSLQSLKISSTNYK